MWGVAAAVGASVVGNYLGGESQSDAAKYAARKQSNAANRATQLQREIWQQGRADLMPYMDLGKRTIPTLETRVNKGFTSEDFTADPGYAFRLAEGEKSINRASGVGGSPYSGATLKALNRFSQDSASGEFDRAFARWQQGTANLMDLVNLGRVSSANAAGVGADFARSASDTMMGAANAQGAAAIAGGNAQAQMYNTLGNLPMNYLLLSKYLDS